MSETKKLVLALMIGLVILGITFGVNLIRNDNTLISYIGLVAIYSSMLGGMSLAYKTKKIV
jgi:hypothetical protein